MARKTTKPHFAICVSREGCDDLEVWKLYRVLPDDAAARDDFLRIVDESGEDYLYPAARFVVIDLPRAVLDRLPALPTSKGA
jgi:hypothetical protein